MELGGILRFGIPLIIIVSLAVYKRKKLPFLSFGILWYFIALSLESFIAVGSDLYFEHRNYLPAAGNNYHVIPSP
jgi:hypothetical protein